MSTNQALYSIKKEGVFLPRPHAQAGGLWQATVLPGPGLHMEISGVPLVRPQKVHGALGFSEKDDLGSGRNLGLSADPCDMMS